MTWVLGISAYYHDSAVALIHDGVVQYAASEERFSRIKHDAAFPCQALQDGLRWCQLQVDQLDYVGFYEKPWLKFERLLETYLAVAPRGYLSFATAMPGWLNKKLYLRSEIRQQLHRLGGCPSRRIVFCEHHQSHAASAFFPSPFDEAAILTVDGVGEWATTCWGRGRGNTLSLEQELRFPHSLGLFYSAFTAYCGFRVNSGEYKLMGLAAHGQPRFAHALREHCLHLEPDGSYRLNMEYFGYCHSLRMTTRKLERLLGFPPRLPESPLRGEDADLAASVQTVLEEALLQLARYVQQQTGARKLCLAGGVALNCTANSRLLREGVFDEVWIQPAAGDAGGALGVAWLLWHQLLKQPRVPRLPDAQHGSLLGSVVNGAEIDALIAKGAVGEYLEDEALAIRVAGMLAEGAVVGCVRGRMEFGPRALGNRSILADPRREDMQRLLNEKIKLRESFRPFAPAVVADRAAEFFEMPALTGSPYMLLTYHVRDGAHLPAVTHVDGSARVQTVVQPQQPWFYSLLCRFGELTGTPVLINTSFNVRGEPPVCSAADAYRCFAATELDALVVEGWLFIRSRQPPALLDQQASHTPATLELD